MFVCGTILGRDKEAGTEVPFGMKTDARTFYLIHEHTNVKQYKT